jgi:3-oxoacyl-(acyl-carrier-protein) synthase
MEPVVVTGFGVVSPRGCTVQELARSLASGVGEAAGDEGSDGLQVRDIPLHAVPADKRARIGRLDRLSRLFLCASYLAVDDAGLQIEPGGSARVGLSFGTGLGCLLTDAEYNQKIVEQGPGAASPRLFAYTVSSAAAGEVSIALGITGPNVTAHMGFAAGLGAIGYGLDLIQLGKADAVLAGGADANGPALAQALRDMGLLKTRDQARPFQDAIAGIWPSEGAVVAVLERADRARQRRARRWGRIAGYAAGFEPTLTRRARQYTGLAETMRRAIARSGITPAEVEVLCSSAHGTPIDSTEREAIASVFGAHRPALVLAPKAVLGESFGASGVLSLALAAALIRHAPALDDLIAFGPDGTLLAPAEAPRRLETASVVMVNALCYSGNIVSLVLHRD